jgi:hypothetical protein
MLMPATPLFDPPNTLHKMDVSVEDLTVDLVNGIRVTLRLTFTDGTVATVMSGVWTDEDAGNLGDSLRDLADAFLYGDGAKAVLAWAQRRDRSVRSRQVRKTL